MMKVLDKLHREIQVGDSILVGWGSRSSKYNLTHLVVSDITKSAMHLKRPDGLIDWSLRQILFRHWSKDPTGAIVISAVIKS